MVDSEPGKSPSVTPIDAVMIHALLGHCVRSRPPIKKTRAVGLYFVKVLFIYNLFEDGRVFGWFKRRV